MACHRVHQFVGLQGLVDQDVQAQACAGQQVIGCAVTAHGHRGCEPRGSCASARGWQIAQQVEAEAIGQLEIEQHHVVVSLGQEGAGPMQGARLLDHTTRPGVLQNHAGAEAMNGLIVDDEHPWGGGVRHRGWCLQRGCNDTTEFKAEQSRVLGSDCKLDKI